MANLHDLLKFMIEKGASDLHITTGIPPSIRVDGKIKLIPGLEPLSATQTKDLCYSILTDAQKHKFEENSELDLSFGVKEPVPLSREHVRAARRCCCCGQDHPL